MYFVILLDLLLQLLNLIYFFSSQFLYCLRDELKARKTDFYTQEFQFLLDNPEGLKVMKYNVSNKNSFGFTCDEFLAKIET